MAYSPRPAGPLVQAASERDWHAVADALGPPEGFSASTLRGAGGHARPTRHAVRDRLTVAMVAPEMVLA